LSFDQHIQTTCNMASDLTSAQLKVVVGEWAPAATDCAKYLNGRGIGSRYNGTYNDKSKGFGSCSGLTGKASTFSDSYKKFLRQFWEAQAITYEKTQGWIQWTWKAEIADEWSYQAGLANGWIPKNPTDFKYPEICG
jgi:glucan 1,3-beta-glucosidase